MLRNQLYGLDASHVPRTLWGALYSPCQTDAELNGRNYPVSLRLSSFRTVSLECPLHLDRTGICHLFKEMYAFHPPAQYFVST